MFPWTRKDSVLDASATPDQRPKTVPSTKDNLASEAFQVLRGQTQPNAGTICEGTNSTTSAWKVLWWLITGALAAITFFMVHQLLSDKTHNTAPTQWGFY